MLPILKLDGPSDDATYFMPLTLAWEDTEEERVTRLTPAALAKIRQQANVGVMADAFYDEPFCRALVQDEQTRRLTSDTLQASLAQSNVTFELDPNITQTIRASGASVVP